MKYIDAEKLIAKIKELNLVTKTYDEQVAFNNALAMVVEIIDSLQQEHSVSEDLEEAVEKQIDEALYKWSYDDEDGIEQYVHDAFIAGAEWQKEQMMGEAVEAEISTKFPVVDRRLISVIDGLKDFKYGDKVHIIVIKEDRK